MNWPKLSKQPKPPLKEGRVIGDHAYGELAASASREGMSLLDRSLDRWN
jgi:hypothetical protein